MFDNILSMDQGLKMDQQDRNSTNDKLHNRWFLDLDLLNNV